ncbi:MAG TPA: PQQ-binding-like beta-propeller repeat protein [Polyangiaceae bacterium]|nr:PQQ-binding-like beta-propeller repeat protein [Polyangiaceae bacterium]
MGFRTAARAAAMFATLIVAGCSSHGSGDEAGAASGTEALNAPVTITLTSPNPVPVLSPVIDVSNSMFVGAGAEIVSGPIAAMGSSGGGVHAEPDALLNETWSRGTADLRDRVKVRGTLHAASRLLGSSVVINASDTAPHFDPPKTLSWTVTYPSTTSGPDQLLNAGVSKSLSPGQYGAVTLNSQSTLTLTAGTYYLKSLDIESQATVKLDQATGPVIIYVESTLISRGAIVSLTADPPDLLIVYLGTSPFLLETLFNGALVAPSTTVTLRAVTGIHTGFFYARDFQILDAHARVQYRAPLAIVTAAKPDPLSCPALVQSLVPAAAFNSSVARYCPNQPNCSNHGVPGPGALPGEFRCICTAPYTGPRCDRIGVTGDGTPTVRPDPLVTTAGNCGPAKGLALSAWPMESFCNAHLGLSPALGTRTSDVAWTFGTAGQLFGQAVLDARGNHYLGASDSSLYALNPAGQLLWRTVLSSPLKKTSLVTHDGSIIASGSDGSITEVSAAGQIVRRVPVGVGQVSAPSVGSDGTLFVTTADKKVVAVSPSGSIAWSFGLSGAPVGSPLLLADADLYVAAANELFKLNAATGAKVWSLPVSDGIVVGPVAAAGTAITQIYFSTSTGDVRGVSENGSPNFVVAGVGVASAAPSFSPDGTLLVPLATGEVAAINRRTGTSRWRARIGSATTSNLAIGADGLIYGGAADGSVAALLPDTGQSFWTTNVGSAVAALSLREDGLLLAARSSGALLAIGSRPLIGGFDNPGQRPSGGSSSGLPWDPSVSTQINQDLGKTGGKQRVPWSVIGRMTGPSFGDLSTPGHGMGDLGGQEACLSSGSIGLGGLKYVSHNDTPLTGELQSTSPPAGAPPQCQLQWCEVASNGQEVVVNYPFARLTQNPASLPAPTSCPATSSQSYCPVDPASKTDRACTVDSDCDLAGGEVCAVFCKDVACSDFDDRCGRRLAGECGSLGKEPAGAFNQQDPATWPCEELRECGETGPIVGFTGDPAVRKTGSLAQETSPPADTVGGALVRVPAFFAPFTDTLNQTACANPESGQNTIDQMDPRSGGAGNDKWGIFIEPDIEHHADVHAKSFFGDDGFNLSLKAGFRTGAKVWGHEIEAINAQIGGQLSICSASYTKSFKILHIEQDSLSDGVNATPPSTAESADCQNAIDTLGSKMLEMKKALYDARLAWDEYRKNNNKPSLALCERTKQVFGNVESGCTVTSARRWIQQYEDSARDLEAYYAQGYQDLVGAARAQLRGQVDVNVPLETPFDGVGASFSYPVGPIVLTLEVEIAGALGATGSLAYSMDPPSAQGQTGPNASVIFAPNAEAHAYVFAGVGLPGVSVGIEGDLLLLGVSAPMQTGVTLTRRQFAEPRSFSSSGLFGVVNGHPGLLGDTSFRQWTINWQHGASVNLETLSGKLDLACRVRLLFFKKTFRKKIADWKGFTKTFDFIGHPAQPMTGARTYDAVSSDIPYPEPDNIEVAFNASPVGPGGDVAGLGPTTSPGVCGNPNPCANPPGGACQANADCCLGSCVSNVCACKDAGLSCVLDGQCCTNDCRNGLCYQEPPQ